ncbi:MAG: SDR family NAD(P)-dependent oxidoreductase [Actinomycetota bacterium]|nr:SDR family NAD(P)-dependent oxidoreductase [Actinomycetota bacterium]
MSDVRPGTPRVVIVTGASSGIGRATVARLRARGDHVVLAARSEAGLSAAELETDGLGESGVSGEALVVPTDVSDRDAVAALFAAARSRFGRVDAVVHSAAVLAYGRFEDVPPEVFEQTLQVTLVGTANVARASLQEFAGQGGGSLVVVGSLLGKIATPYMSSYVTAKWAVHGLVRCLQIEARSTPGVEVSLVSPGGVDTPVYLQAGTYVGLHGRPPPPVVTPEHVARTIVHCLDHPQRDAGVGPANPLTVAGFRMLPGVFDLIVTPLMKLGGLGREAVDPTPGNVLAATPSGESTRGDFAGTRVAQTATMALSVGGAALLAVRRLVPRRLGAGG